MLTEGEFWLKLDKIFFTIFGTPSTSDIHKDINGYFQIFKIYLQAKDKVGFYNEISFLLTVKKEVPVLKKPIGTLSYHSGDTLKFTFTKETFSTTGTVPLKYTANLGELNTIKFNSERR